MAISLVSYVSDADTDMGASFVIQKPSGVQSGDFLVAVAGYSSPSEVVVTPPPGWTHVRTVFAPGALSCQLAILWRVAGVSEPGSWTGSFSGGVDSGVVATAAYRGASGISVEDGIAVGEASSYSTSEVTNVNSAFWTITSGVFVHTSSAFGLESDESAERVMEMVEFDGTVVGLGVWDSDGNVPAGDHSRTVSRGLPWHSSVAWIGVLAASDLTSSGVLGATLPAPSFDGAMDLSNDCALGVQLPSLLMEASGTPSPPSGGFGVVIHPDVSVTGNSALLAALGITVFPLISVEMETRKFGIRVTIVPEESRRIVPRLGSDTS